MSKITVLAHIDALRHDYVTAEDMPFLFELGRKGISGKIIPPFGFEPDGAYLTGTWPEQYEGGTHFVYSKNHWSIPFTQYFPRFLDNLNVYAQYPFRRVLQFLISKYAPDERTRRQPYICQIPFKFLKYFDFCEKKFPFEPGFGKNAKTIYEYMDEKKIPYAYRGYPLFSSLAELVQNEVFSGLENSTRFLFFLIGDLDDIGHNFGPDSAQRHTIAQKVDAALESIYGKLAKEYDTVDFFVFGDHGMVAVEKYFDFNTILNKLPLRIGTDYIYFLDSTFARFWVFSDKADSVIRERLLYLDCGSIVSEQDKAKYHIHYPDRKFGDIIFWLHGGWMIYPNFWHVRKKKLGMHGYRDEVFDNHSAFVMFKSIRDNAQKVVSTISMTDINDIVNFSIYS